MATSKTEEEEILTFDVSDEVLEIAGTDKTDFTFGVCTLDQPGCFSVNFRRRPEHAEESLAERVVRFNFCRLNAKEQLNSLTAELSSILNYRSVSAVRLMSGIVRIPDSTV